MRPLTRGHEVAGWARGDWGVGQLADRRTVNPEVAGSSPAAPALRGIQQLDKSSVYRRNKVRTLARSLVLASFALLAPTVATAHAKLVSSSPRAGVQLTTSPRLITLRFSEILMGDVSRIALTGSGGDTIQLGSAPANSMGSHIISAVVAAPLAAGSYKVHWSAAGRDGHPERGSFSFTVLALSPSVAPGAATGDSAGAAPAQPAAV